MNYFSAGIKTVLAAGDVLAETGPLAVPGGGQSDQSLRLLGLSSVGTILRLEKWDAANLAPVWQVPIQIRANTGADLDKEVQASFVDGERFKLVAHQAVGALTIWVTLGV